MYSEIKPRSLKNTFASIVLVISVLVIFGWIFKIEVLKSIMPDYISMKFNTAICFIFLCISILLESREGKKAIVTPIILNAVVVIIAALSYIQELVHIDFGIDQLIIADNKAMEAGEPFPGRMSPITSILFILIASSLLLIKCKIKLRYVQYTLHAVTLMSIIAIIGYMFDAPDFYTLNFVTSMAVHTSVAFFLLSLSASLINSHLGCRVYSLEEK